MVDGPETNGSGSGSGSGSARKLPFFRSSHGPLARRRATTVHSHRIIRSLFYLIAWIFVLLVCIANLADKPVLRSTYFLYLDLTDIIPVSVPNAFLINSIARSIGLHDFYQVGLWGFCEGYNGDGITGCSSPKALYAFNPVDIILNELLAGASIALPSDIQDPLNLARVASHWMFGLFIAAAVLNFIMIFISPLAVSSRPPQTIKLWAAASTGENGTQITPAGRPPHRRRTFVWLRSLPMLFLAFFTALITIVASAVATVMFEIFAHVFTNADPSLNIHAHVGTQMLVFMWIGAGFSLLGFIIQLGSCCASCCGGRKARKQLKSQGVDWRELEKMNAADHSGRQTPAERDSARQHLEPHAVTTN